MATKQFLRNTTVNGITDAAIASIIYDMTDSAGAAVDTAVTRCPATSGEVQATKTDGGSTIAWISRRIASGFTLTQSDISMWQVESNMNANVGGRYRIYKYSGGVLTELGGGPFDDGVEMNTSDREDTWVGNNTDTAFAVDDRIVIKYFVTNVGSSSSSFTATAKFNEADGSTGDSFINFAETISFKAEGIIVTPAVASFGAGRVNPTIVSGHKLVLANISFGTTRVNPTVIKATLVTPAPITLSFAGKRIFGLAALMFGAPEPIVTINVNITITPSPITFGLEVAIKDTFTPTPTSFGLGTIGPTVVQSGSNQVVTPTPISFRASPRRAIFGLAALMFPGTPEPTVSTGSGSPIITPTPISFGVSTVNPVVRLGSITFVPATITFGVATINPTVVITGGGVTVAPTAITFGIANIAPTTILGSLTIAPTTRSFAIGTVNPVVRLGSLTLIPPARSTAFSTIAPTVLIQGGSLTITPAAITFAVSRGGITTLGGLPASLIGVVPVRYVVGQTKNVVPVQTVGAGGIGIVPVREFVGPANVVPVREVGGGETPRVKVVKV